MANVELRDIRTDADRAAVMALRRRPGQERYLGSVGEHFAEAIEYPQAKPRMWAVHDADRVVGFVMISDGIPADTLAADPELVGPYFLWKLLVDAPLQGRGYGRAIVEAVGGYVRQRGGEVLYTSCVDGEGSPQPFYLRLGFVKTGRIADGEDVLALDLGRAGELC
ncbi:MAG TPA: GNAT family N-acetyltransferase [Candidatus Limnocylindrales bacterium]|jgi:diamine N-acetyltransferase